MRVDDHRDERYLGDGETFGDGPDQLVFGDVLPFDEDFAQSAARNSLLLQTFFELLGCDKSLFEQEIADFFLCHDTVDSSGSG